METWSPAWNPMSGIWLRMSRSILPLSEIEFPAVDLTSGGINRFNADKLVLGSSTTSLNAPKWC